MKIMIKLMLLGLIGLLAAPLIIKGPDGRPIMSLDDLNLFSSSPSAYKNTHDNASLTTVYKWQDAEGQWHFSDRQIEGDNHQTLKYNPNSNIIQSMVKKEDSEKYAANNNRTPLEYINRATSSQNKPSEEEEEMLFNQRYYHDQGSNGGGGSAVNGPTTIHSADVSKLLEQAKEVQELINARNQQLEDTLRR